MHRSASDLAKAAQRLLKDYGNGAEEEAEERAILLDAIGSHREARDWIEIRDHVADLRRQDIRPAGELVAR